MCCKGRQLRDQTQYEETGGFEGCFVRQKLKQVALPEVRASSRSRSRAPNDCLTRTNESKRDWDHLPLNGWIYTIVDHDE